MSRMPSSVWSPAAFCGRCAGASRYSYRKLVSGVANLGAETFNTRATRCACLKLSGSASRAVRRQFVEDMTTFGRDETLRTFACG